jgi:NADPH2:quinone reductase
MKAAYIETTGPPANIRYGDLQKPVVSDGQVLVQMTAVAVDPIDTYIRQGTYPIELPTPFIIGRDMSGVVTEIGTGVTHFKPGDRVWCNNQGYAGRQGTFAGLLAIDERLLYPLPAGVDPLAAVAVVHSALTAVVGLFDRAKLRSGETVFVNGGDGNVGTAVLQLAKASGARVAVTAGAEIKAQWCRELGADRVIDYRTENLEQALREFAPQGIDVYWDAAGKPDLESAVSLLARRGRVVLMSGLAHRSVLPIGAFYTHNLTLLGFTVTDATVDELAAAARQINQALAAGSIRAKTSAVLPLSQAAEAHRRVEQDKLFGKIVLVPGD